MAINNITQTISTIPQAGKRGVDIQTVFVIKQEDFQDHLQGKTVGELNTLKTQMNTMAGAMNTTASQVNTNANTATTQAGIATTKASEASASATSASASATTATTKASEASASATTASTKASEASASATSASTSASTASTKASQASTSATTASTKASEASASATSASQSLDSINGILATLPDGSINDTLLGTDKAFSNQSLVGAFGRLSSPLLDLPLKNSLTMKAGVGNATFTRASTATYIDRYGVLKTAGVDEPRFEKEGYLNEGSSTNLILNSETLTNQSVTVISGTSYTISFYGTGVVTLGGAFLSNINGLGMFPTRTKLTFVATSTTLTISVSGEAKLAQLEALPFATSYIPTTTSAVTRSADVLQVTRENNFPNAENNEEGYSVAFTYDCLGMGVYNQAFWLIGMNWKNSVSGSLTTTLLLRCYVSKNSSYRTSATLPINPLGSNKVVQTQSNTLLKQYINGTLASNDVNTLGTLGGGINSITFINIGGVDTSTFFGHISDFKVYDVSLTPVEIKLLSGVSQ